MYGDSDIESEKYFWDDAPNQWTIAGNEEKHGSEENM